MVSVMAECEVIPDDWWSMPLFRLVESLQDDGVNIWVAGANDVHVLVVNADTGNVSVGPPYTTNGLGRWECSVNHWRGNVGLYHNRFPRR